MARVIWVWGLAAVLAGCVELDKRAVPNQPPTATLTVSPEGAVGKGAQVTLDASGSKDPEGKPLDFRWRQLAGDFVTLSDPSGAITTFEAPTRVQMLSFSLTVSDGFNETEPVYVSIEVAFNSLPVADAGEARVVLNGSQVLLSGGASDADGDPIVAYQWHVDAAPPTELADSHELQGDDAQNAIFIPWAKGIYTLSLVVTDARGAVSLPSPLVIKSENNPPVADAPPIVSAQNGELVILAGWGDDEDAEDSLTYRWRLTLAPPGAALPVLEGAESDTLSLTTRGKGIYGFELVASDGEVESEPALVVVAAENNLPVVSAEALYTPNLMPLTLVAEVADPDTDSVSLAWRVVDSAGKDYALVPAGGGLTSFTPFGKGDYLLEVEPFDGEATGAPVQLTVHAENLAPVAVATASSETVSTGQSFELSAAESSDPDGPPPSMTYVWSVKQGSASFVGPSDGESVTVAAGTLKQSLLFGLVVQDETGEPSAQATVRVVVDNSTPVAVAGEDGYGGASETLALDAGDSYDLELSGLEYTWSSPSHPELVFEPSNKVAAPSVTMPAVIGQTVSFELTVSDGQVESAPDAVSFTVVPSNATHVFVHAGAGCAGACNGTKQAPFTSLTAGAAASAGLALPKPVLVAAGTYGASVVPHAISVTGGCDPLHWLCDGSAGASVIQAGPAESIALDITSGSGPTAGTIERLTVYGSDGSGLATDASVTGVRCAACRVTLRELLIEANGSVTTTGTTYGVSITDSPGPVRLESVSALAGRGQYNHGVAIYASTDVVVVDSTLDTLAAVRSNVPGDQNVTNHTVLISGTGSNLRFENNRIMVHGNANLDHAHMVTHDGNSPAVFAGNLMWFLAAAGGNRLNFGAWGANGGVFFGCSSAGSTYFVNNTMLGNDLAWTANKDFHAFILFDFGYCDGASGLSFALNNYIEQFRGIAAHAGTGQLQLTNNSIHTFTTTACSGPSSCTGSLDALNDGYGPVTAASDGNLAEDCGVEDLFAGDYHLEAGSPCLGTGAADPRVPETDMDGDARPASNMDRGADEVLP